MTSSLHAIFSVVIKLIKINDGRRLIISNYSYVYDYVEFIIKKIET